MISIEGVESILKLKTDLTKYNLRLHIESLVNGEENYENNPYHK